MTQPVAGQPRCLPLDGVRVLDMTRLLPGNFATLLLSGLGADVIKIEEVRGGDGIRHMYRTGDHNESGGHVVLNRGKRSAAIDLKTSAGREAMLDLVGSAHVLIDSFRPGVLDRLGLTAEALKTSNPQLVHVSINAFGATGPYTAIPAHDLNSAGYAGALGLVAGADGALAMPAIQSADLAAGLHAALAVLAGLRVAERDGASYHADVAMTDSIATLLPLTVSAHASTAKSPPVPDLLTGALACYGMYKCADGQWLTVGGLEAKFFGRMVELMGTPELALDQYNPLGQEALRARLASEFGKRPRDEWMKLLAGEDTCVGPVLTIEQALQEPHFVERGIITQARFRDGTLTPVFKSVPWVVGGDDGLQAPELGEHTEAVLSEAGLSPERIAELRQLGIVGPAS